MRLSIGAEAADALAPERDERYTMCGEGVKSTYRSVSVTRREPPSQERATRVDERQNELERVAVEGPIVGKRAAQGAARACWRTEAEKEGGQHAPACVARDSTVARRERSHSWHVRAMYVHSAARRRMRIERRVLSCGDTPCGPCARRRLHAFAMTKPRHSAIHGCEERSEKR